MWYLPQPRGGCTVQAPNRRTCAAAVAVAGRDRDPDRGRLADPTRCIPQRDRARASWGARYRHLGVRGDSAVFGRGIDLDRPDRAAYATTASRGDRRAWCDVSPVLGQLRAWP